ncbi:DUF1254 domain-containing protein [Mycobacterium sp. Y57]|uniref:DUF1254 domain-containing protein n=1 Tax=Mycolicibacterium xanthum TaxID=2796469 RepID=UPI001C85E9EC|nr:DUF1254 domain-containing protein [Mycolicibacterium xanthum]MBX7433813.1 DUF1254 domain-containing protein [Mycolicibacterium xanthum]
MTTLSDDLRTLSYEAFIYFYPLVTMDITRMQAINAPTGPLASAPNQFQHIREYPSADFRAVVRPNFDTLYSTAWLDLTGGPVILSVPDTDDRYFMLPLLDMWTDVFANPGKRTTGTAAQKYVLVGPGPAGTLPDNIPVIEAPTPYVWIIGRTQTNGPADYSAVHAVQDSYTITPLAPAAGPYPKDEGYDVTTEPLRIVNGMAALDYLTYATELLTVNPPHRTDFSILARLANLGIEAGKPFDAGRFGATERAEIEAGKKDALAAMETGATTLGTIIDGWISTTENMGVYGNSYFRRAVVTLIGLGANPPEDAVYPLLVTDVDGQQLSGENNYLIHFDADKLPPVDAFWSVTMYDEEGYQVANEINRFAIGDRDALRYNTDSSLDLYLRHTNPGPDRESNWLPAPPGPLGVTLRLYAPRRAVLDGTWNPPPVHKV